MRHLSLPLRIDYDAIARGMIDLFTDEDRVILRFGMLPAKKMESLDDMIKEKLEHEFDISRHDPVREEGNTHFAVVDSPDWPRHVDFNFSRIVADIVHNISLAIYKHGDLVV
jgi:hypothetical protein